MKRNVSVIIMAIFAIMLTMVFASCEPAHTHELSKVDAKESNCTEKGNKEYYTCSGCDKLFSDAEGQNEIDAPVTIDEKGHVQVTVIGTKPTCTESGISNGVKCSVCEAVIEAQTELPPSEHKKEVIPGFAATHTENGLTDGEWCPDCEVIFVSRKVIPAEGHTEEIIPGKAATCTETGLTDGKKCSVCKETLVAQEIIPITHTPGEAAKENVVKPNCTAIGTYDSVIRCALCGTEISREAKTEAALGHTPNEDANCTIDKVCTVCDELISSAPGHTYDNADDTTCNACGYVREIECQHTNIQDYEGYAATCTEDGLTDGKKCLDCGEWTVNQEIITAIGHNFTDGVCANGCGYYYLTLTNATVVGAEGENGVYIIKEGTDVTINANAEPSSKIFVGYDKDSVDNRVETDILSDTYTFTMPASPVSYTAVYNEVTESSILGAANKYKAQTGVTAVNFTDTTKYGYSGYTFTIASNAQLNTSFTENIQGSTLNTQDGIDRVAKIILKNNGSFGVTVEVCFSYFGMASTSGVIHVGAGETVVCYADVCLFVSNPYWAFLLKGVDEGASGSTTLDVAVGAAHKYTNIDSKTLVTDAEFVNLNGDSTTEKGTADNTKPLVDATHSGKNGSSDLSFAGGNRFYDAIGALHWTTKASQFVSTKVDSLSGEKQTVTQRYVAENIAGLTYTDGDEITLYVRLLNYTNTEGMYDNEFEIFVIQGTEEAPVTLIRETVKLDEENMEVIVKLTFKPKNADGKIYIGAIKKKSVAEAEAKAAGVTNSNYNYNVVMQYAYSDSFGEVDETFAQAE